MYPVLIVDGKEHEVSNLDFYKKNEIVSLGIFVENDYKVFAKSENGFSCNEKNKSVIYGELKWINRYTKVVEEIEKDIEMKSKELIELAKIKMENEKKLPFPDKCTSEKYYNKEREMIGMIQAVSIIEEFID